MDALPKYQLLPRLSAEEFHALEQSIIEHGVLVPVEYDEAGEIIDGHHRVEICESLGLVDWPRFVRKGLAELDKRKLSRELNFARRHLSTAQKQEVIAGQLRDTPSISSRAIAAMLGVDDKTVAAVRRRMVDAAEIPHHEEVEGRDGVKQPARKTIKTSFVPEPENTREYLRGAQAIRSLQQKDKHAVRLAHMDMVAERGRASAPGVLKPYPVYYFDAPWQFGVRSEVTGREKSAENHYPTMPTDELVELLSGLIGGDWPAVCFMWATNPMLLDALRVLEACGFTYVHHWVWDKEVAGTGYWGRDQHEILLIGRRGDIAAPLPGSQPATVYREKKGRHSAKPAYYAEQIEKLYPGIARVELFARQARPGWDVWGFESGAAEAPAEPVSIGVDLGVEHPPAPGGDAVYSGAASDLDKLMLLSAICAGVAIEGAEIDEARAAGLVEADRLALTEEGFGALFDLRDRSGAAAVAVPVVDLGEVAS